MAEDDKPTSKSSETSYGNVIITLDNVLIPDAKLSQTPSSIDGLDMETEMDLRILGCEFIQTAGILLKLPQVAMATGQVVFQRFYYSKSLVKHNMETVAMACTNLASKIEEAPRRLRDVINVFHHIRQKRNNKAAEPIISDQKYINLKNQVIKAERRLLKELGFCVHVKHPHKMIVTYLQALECESNTQLVRTAWNYMNDSLRTDVFVRYTPETVACACISLSARQIGLPLPSNPPWYGLMGAGDAEVEDISLTILRLYTRKIKSYEFLDKRVERCRMIIQEAKLRAKGQLTESGANSQAGTPSSFSPHTSRPNSPKVNNDSPGIPKMYKVNSNAIKEEPHSGSAGSNKSRENGKVDKHKRTPSSSISSRSRSSSRGRRSDSHESPMDRHSSRDHSSRSRSTSPRNNRKRQSSSKRKRDDHKRSRRDRSASPKHRHGHKHKRSRTPPRGYDSRSRSRSRTRSRSRERRHKHHYSPYNDSAKESSHSRHKSRSKHRRDRSRSRSRSPISRSRKSKRDSGRSNDHRRR